MRSSFFPQTRMARCARIFTISLAVISGTVHAQTAAPAKPHHPLHVLVVAQTKGWQHDSIPDAMTAIYTMGHDSGLWDTILRTDTDLLTTREIPKNGKNLNYFDAVVFVSPSGELDMSADQKRDLLAFVHDRGKGFVGVHGALDTLFNWHDYGTMLGGYFDQHPWDTFDAPIRNEQPDSPIVKHFPASFTKYEEIYQPKDWSRADVNVLLSLDPGKLNYANNPRVHRADHDFAVAWTKMYGKGRVFYSSLGHTPISWQDPDIRTMYFEAIKWSLGLTDASTTSHPVPTR